MKKKPVDTDKHKNNTLSKTQKNTIQPEIYFVEILML